MGIGSEDETAFAFEGRWTEFLPIALTNTLLTFATLGIYRFWGITRERDYLWSRTRFIDDRLEWTGKGIELLVGFLIALALFIAPLFVLSFVLQGLALQGEGLIVGVLIIALYGFLFYLFGLAIFRGLRYRLSRTSWHGIHGGSDDKGLAYGWAYLWKSVVAGMTLLLIYPWAMTSLWKDRWEKMSFGPHEFISNPKWGPLMKRYLLAWFMPWIMLVILGIGFASAFVAAEGPASDPSPGMVIFLTIFLVLGFYIIVPLAALVYYAAYMREVIGTMTLSTLQFAFVAKTKDWVMLFLGNAGLYLVALLIAAVPIASLGLFDQFATLDPEADPMRDNPIAYFAFMLALIIPFAVVGPFLRYRNWRFFIRHLEAGGEINLAELTQSQTVGIKQGEGLLDAFDMGAI